MRLRLRVQERERERESYSYPERASTLLNQHFSRERRDPRFAIIMVLRREGAGARFAMFFLSSYYYGVRNRGLRNIVRFRSRDAENRLTTGNKNNK